MNLFLLTGGVSDERKDAIILPCLKKRPLTHKNYLPISNLLFVSKTCEKVVASHLTNHLLQNKLMEPFRSNSSTNLDIVYTETALLALLLFEIVLCDQVLIGKAIL